MSDRRPLPDSDELQDWKANDRLVRWVTVLMGLIIMSLVVLLALWWIAQR